MSALVLALALLLQQQAPPPQRPAEITISVEEYARLKTCEAKQIENEKITKQKSKHLHWIAIGAVAAIAIVAVAKKKKAE